MGYVVPLTHEAGLVKVTETDWTLRAVTVTEDAGEFKTPLMKT